MKDAAELLILTVSAAVIGTVAGLALAAVFGLILWGLKR